MVEYIYIINLDEIINKTMESRILCINGMDESEKKTYYFNRCHDINSGFIRHVERDVFLLLISFAVEIMKKMQRDFVDGSSFIPRYIYFKSSSLEIKEYFEDKMIDKYDKKIEELKHLN